MTHNAAWHAARRLGIGGSDATKIMAGEWRELWHIKTCRLEDRDLSDVLPVQIGVATEALNRAWFARNAGLAISTDACEHVIHPEHKFMRANLDGRVDPDCVYEAKHVSDRYKLDEIVSRYFWQLQHCIAVAGSSGAYLSVFFGNSRWEYATVPRDDTAIADLVARERAFWGYVERDQEPEDQIKETVTVDVSALREVDLSTNNYWCANAADWLAHRKAAKLFDKAASELKGAVEADVGRAYGAGIQIKRARNGALTIAEA
jgi:predicted phage-related endonuclease